MAGFVSQPSGLLPFWCHTCWWLSRWPVSSDGRPVRKLVDTGPHSVHCLIPHHRSGSNHCTLRRSHVLSKNGRLHESGEGLDGLLRIDHCRPRCACRYRKPLVLDRTVLRGICYLRGGQGSPVQSRLAESHSQQSDRLVLTYGQHLPKAPLVYHGAFFIYTQT